MKRALIVDDNAAMRRYIATTLGSEGYVCIEAEHGLDGLHKLGPDIDLVVTDLVMPVMDGFAFLRGLFLKPSPPAVIVCSGETSPLDGHQIDLMARTAGRLTKPFHPAELLALVRVAQDSRPGENPGDPDDD